MHPQMRSLWSAIRALIIKLPSMKSLGWVSHGWWCVCIRKSRGSNPCAAAFNLRGLFQAARLWILNGLSCCSASEVGAC